MAESEIKVLADNRRARHDYFVDEHLECGIVLQGTEVKSLRNGKFNFSDAYAEVSGGELWLIGFHITPYEQGNIFNHDPDRKRKLLANRTEIIKLKRKSTEKGFTLIPMRVYLKKRRIKVEIGLCKGKKLHDKRQDIKTKDLKRSSDRGLKIKY